MIVLAGLLIYSNSLSSPFLFDDQNSIIGNSQIRRLWPLSIPLSPPQETPVAGRPLVNLSFAINYAVGGLDPRGYHLANVVIHVLAALVLFGLVRRTLELPKAGGLTAYGYLSTNVACVCALLWLVHPLNTEAVNYFSQRTESMMGLFYLLTIYFAVRGKGAGGRGQGDTGRGSGHWNVLAVLACAAGMACKESMVTAPIAVMLYDRIFLFDSWKQMVRARRGLYAGLAATWLVLAALMSSTPRSTVGFGGDITPVTYLLNQFEMIARYLRLAIWPRDLVIDYGLPRLLTFKEVLPQAALVIALGLVTVAALVRWPAIGFLGAWFFITLAPTSSVVPILSEVGAERRMYLPLAGLIVLAVVAGYRLIYLACGASPVGLARAGLTRPAPQASTRATADTHAGADIHASADAYATAHTPASAARLASYLSIAVAMCVCVLLAAGTIARNREYGSRLSLARTSVDRWPSGRGHYMLGTELLTAGERAAGLAELRVSAADFPGARYALGTELLSEGRIDAAIEELDAFIRALPAHANVPPARDMLGRAFAAQGRLDLAADQFEQLLRDHPGYARRDDVRRLMEEIRNARFPRS